MTHDYRLATMVARGERERAETLLAALNKVQRAFGRPEFDMPEPAGPTDGLVTCPVR